MRSSRIDRSRRIATKVGFGNVRGDMRPPSHRVTDEVDVGIRREDLLEAWKADFIQHGLVVSVKEDRKIVFGT